MIPETLVATRIASVVSGFTLGTNCFAGPVRSEYDEIPGKSVFTYTTGGPPPIEVLASTGQIRESNLSVFYRSAKGSYATALTEARAIRDALHRSQLTDTIIVLVSNSEPFYLGRTDSGRDEFTLTVRVLATV